MRICFSLVREPDRKYTQVATEPSDSIIFSRQVTIFKLYKTRLIISLQTVQSPISSNSVFENSTANSRTEKWACQTIERKGHSAHYHIDNLWVLLNDERTYHQSICLQALYSMNKTTVIRLINLVHSSKFKLQI